MADVCDICPLRTNQVYEFHGLSPVSVFPGYRSTFVGTMQGFKRLTDPNKLKVKPARLRIRAVPSAGSLRQALRSLDVPADKLDELALLNGKKIEKPVPKETSDWGHFLYDASGNVLWSNDGSISDGWTALATVEVHVDQRDGVTGGSLAYWDADGDYVVAVALRRIPQRGAIVVFSHPGTARFDLVKRVIGLPGELVVLREGRVDIDGATLAEPWATAPTHPDGEWRLGADQIFVLGDNRGASVADSRSLGPVGLAAATWQVVARYWPPARIGRIRA